MSTPLCTICPHSYGIQLSIRSHLRSNLFESCDLVARCIFKVTSVFLADISGAFVLFHQIFVGMPSSQFCLLRFSISRWPVASTSTEFPLRLSSYHPGIVTNVVNKALQSIVQPLSLETVHESLLVVSADFTSVSESELVVAK